MKIFFAKKPNNLKRIERTNPCHLSRNVNSNTSWQEGRISEPNFNSKFLNFTLECPCIILAICKKLLDDLKDRRGYSHVKEEALDRTMCRNRFGRGFGPVVRQHTE